MTLFLRRNPHEKPLDRRFSEAVNLYHALLDGLWDNQRARAAHLTFVGGGGPQEKGVFEQLVETFNTDNPDIVIEYTQIPADYIVTLNTMIAGGIPPDIAYIPDGDFSAFVTKGQLVNIQSLVDSSEIINPDSIWISALGRYRYDREAVAFGQGDLYALPKDIGPTVLYINVDLFEQAGVALPDPNEPLTWDEVVEIGTQITLDSNGNHPGDDGFDPNSVEIWGLAIFGLRMLCNKLFLTQVREFVNLVSFNGYSTFSMLFSE